MSARFMAGDVGLCLCNQAAAERHVTKHLSPSVLAQRYEATVWDRNRLTGPLDIGLALRPNCWSLTQDQRRNFSNKRPSNGPFRPRYLA